jgi:DNA-binding response OmpR family regulator
MKKKILIVDDDSGIVEVVKIILEENQFEVIPSTNAYVVKKLADTHTPDAIILDLWMSGINGELLCKQLKKSPKTKHIPIIVLSALNDGDKKAAHAGADDFLAKPFNIDDLIAVIKKHLPA